MVFADALTKAGRLVELQLAFWANPKRGLSSSQLARRLGVAPRTVRRYLEELSGTGRLPVFRDGAVWKLLENARLEVPPVRFHLEEAAAVYLAARLLLQHADEPNPAVRGALLKLGAVVPAELRPAFDRIADRLDERRDDRFASIFQAIAYGWALRRVVRVTYAPRTRPEPFTADLRPYLLEPAAVGSALYAVGRLDPPGALRVLKLERIEAAKLTEATFHAPPLPPLLDRLDRAWGVWLSDEEPEEVVLRFGPEVARRVGETRWHPSQRLEELPDGSLRAELTVASTVELVPWILGWGSGCEVERPASLRTRVADELRRAVERYEAPR